MSSEHLDIALGVFLFMSCDKVDKDGNWTSDQLKEHLIAYRQDWIKSDLPLEAWMAQHGKGVEWLDTARQSPWFCDVAASLVSQSP